MALCLLTDEAKRAGCLWNCFKWTHSSNPLLLTLLYSCLCYPLNSSPGTHDQIPCMHSHGSSAEPPFVLQIGSNLFLFAECINQENHVWKSVSGNVVKWASEFLYVLFRAWRWFLCMSLILFENSFRVSGMYTFPFRLPTLVPLKKLYLCSNSSSELHGVLGKSPGQEVTKCGPDINYYLTSDSSQLMSTAAVLSVKGGGGPGGSCDSV